MLGTEEHVLISGVAKCVFWTAKCVLFPHFRVSRLIKGFHCICTYVHCTCTCTCVYSWSQTPMELIHVHVHVYSTLIYCTIMKDTSPLAFLSSIHVQCSSMLCVVCAANHSFFLFPAGSIPRGGTVLRREREECSTKHSVPHSTQICNCIQSTLMHHILICLSKHVLYFT